MTAQPLPFGFGLEFDSDTKTLDRATLFGGSPARIMRLSAAGQTALAELRRGPVASAAAAALARRLTDAGVAHPLPPPSAVALDVTVVIPVRDRPEALQRCLAALGTQYPVTVVDDGSTDPAAVAEVTRRHGATLVTRAVNGGPGAARNTGLAYVHSEFVAFIDSDCVPDPNWVAGLSGHFADPLVAVVAPRIVAAPVAQGSGQSLAGRFTEVNGSLDLGDRQARVGPGTRVSYVPSAALLVRRAALEAVMSPGAQGPFDPVLRVGEDVDLIWRLHEAGWQIRYEPRVLIGHAEPQTWRGVLGRRMRYGTSAAPLALRHPQAMAPLALHPWPSLTVAALLARRPLLAAAAFTGSVLGLRNTLVRAGIPSRGVVAAMAGASRQTWLGAGRYLTQFAAPLLIWAMVRPGGRTRRRRWGRRAAAASLLLGPPATRWRALRPPLDPVRFCAGQLADDISYGAGVWAGSLRQHSVQAIRPDIRWQPLRIDPLLEKLQSRRPRT
jgi:mycofactocin system glycosyltransferase